MTRIDDVDRRPRASWPRLISCCQLGGPEFKGIVLMGRSDPSDSEFILEQGFDETMTRRV